MLWSKLIHVIKRGPWFNRRILLWSTKWPQWGRFSIHEKQMENIYFDILHNAEYILNDKAWYFPTALKIYSLIKQSSGWGTEVVLRNLCGTRWEKVCYLFVWYMGKYLTHRKPLYISLLPTNVGTICIEIIYGRIIVCHYELSSLATILKFNTDKCLTKYIYQSCSWA